MESHRADPTRASGFAGHGELRHLDVDRFLHEDSSRWQRLSYRHTFRHYQPQRVAALLAEADLRTLGAHALRRGRLCDTPDEDVNRKVIHAYRKLAPAIS